MIDQLRRAAIGERLMSDESVVEGPPSEEVNRQSNVGVIGYFAMVAGIGEHLSHQLAAPLREPEVHFAQRWFLFGGIDEGRHQPSGRLSR
jgi:hypothetical protein